MIKLHVSNGIWSIMVTLVTRDAADSFHRGENTSWGRPFLPSLKVLALKFYRVMLTQKSTQKQNGLTILLHAGVPYIDSSVAKNY